MQVGATTDNFGDNLESFPVDARISYPSYKSFDDFIDTKILASLDEYIAEGIRRHIEKSQSEDFFISYYRLDKDSPYQPGVREIWLSRTRAETPYDYLDLNRADLWEPTESTRDFSLLMDFIETLPFKTRGRMLIIYDDAGLSVPAHRDHIETELCHEFLWFRTNFNKPFYLLDPASGAKKYVAGYSAWFDSVNQYHGSDAGQGLSFSVRVDGEFTDEFRAKIPKPAFNLASTPSFWAAIES